MREVFALYHGFFHLNGGEENYFCATVKRWSVDKVLDTRGEYSGHDSRFRNLLRQSPGAPVHLVQGAHEETTGGQRTVYPLHLSEMHLPAHDATRVAASRPPPRTLMPSSPLPLAARYGTVSPTVSPRGATGGPPSGDGSHPDRYSQFARPIGSEWSCWRRRRRTPRHRQTGGAGS